MQLKLGTGHKSWLSFPPALSLFTFDACQNEFWYLQWGRGRGKGGGIAGPEPGSWLILNRTQFCPLGFCLILFRSFVLLFFIYISHFSLLFFLPATRCCLTYYPKTGCAFDWLAFVVYLIICIRRAGLLKIDFEIDWRLPPSAFWEFRIFIFVACKSTWWKSSPQNCRCPWFLLIKVSSINLLGTHIWLA